MSKYERLARMLKIVTLVKANPRLSRADLARLCEVESVRTIQRDIYSLSLAGVPIYWSGKGYEIMPNFFLPPMALTIEEAFSILLSTKAYSEGEGQFHEESLASALAKIKSSLPLATRELLEAGSSKVDVEGRKASDAGGVIGKLYQSIMEAKQLCITYYSYSSKKISERIVNPYALTFRRRSWYLIGYCYSRHKVLMFRSNRIKSIKYTGESFRPPQNFSVDEYMGNSWQVMKGDETKVIVKFNSEVASLIKEVNWHPTQQIIDLPDGSILFVAEVAGTKEISLWILSYGCNAEVLYPEEFRDKIAEIAKNMAKLYSSKRPEKGIMNKVDKTLQAMLSGASSN